MIDKSLRLKAILLVLLGGLNARVVAQDAKEKLADSKARIQTVIREVIVSEADSAKIIPTCISIARKTRAREATINTMNCRVDDRAGWVMITLSKLDTIKSKSVAIEEISFVYNRKTNLIHIVTPSDPKNRFSKDVGIQASPSEFKADPNYKSISNLLDAVSATAKPPHLQTRP